MLQGKEKSKGFNEGKGMKSSNVKVDGMSKNQGMTEANGDMIGTTRIPSHPRKNRMSKGIRTG
jgi:hypothetical protein